MTNETKHTPEPWRVMDEPHGAMSDVGIYAADDWTFDFPLRSLVAVPLNGRSSRANAARIVACVNACAGWTSPANMRAQAEQSIKDAVTIAELQQQGCIDRTALATAREERESLRAQRDALAAALRECESVLSDLPSVTSEHSRVRHAWVAARAALASLERG